MTCKWCGCTAEGANHGTTEECIAALEREIATLRRLVAQQIEESEKPFRKNVLPWKKKRTG